MKDLEKIREFFSKPLEEAKEETAIDMAKRQLDALGVKYEMSKTDKVRPFKVIYQPINKSDEFYDKFEDIVDLFNLKGVVKSSMNEANGFKSGKEFINIKLQKYPKAVAKINQLISMVGESNFTMEMAEWIFDFFNNASYESPMTKLRLENEAKEEDPTDIIAMDVPLFIRMLEWAREDAQTDMELHDATERAIEAVKLRGLLSMEDYIDIVGVPKDELDEVRLLPKNQIEATAAKLAAQIFSKTVDKTPAIKILTKALEDAYRALDPSIEIREEEGYSPQLVSPKNPKGTTPGLTDKVMNQILRKIAGLDDNEDIEELKRLGEGVIEEELCPKGKAYIKKRMAAGEKSSAYLSGRAVKVCKGQMKG